MHKEIIQTPVKETLKSLHNKFGYLGYLRREVYDGQSCVLKYLFSGAWSEEHNNDSNSSNIKNGYCKVSSDVLISRLPRAIKTTMQRQKLKYNKNKTTRLGGNHSNNNKRKKKTLSEE
jgi:hypothetical protein